jgi:heme-degrading monooxygenase HmoA
MVARIVRFRGSTQAVEEQQERAYRRLLPVLEELDGFRGLIFLGAPEREEALALALWANEKAAEASSDAARALREGTTEAGETVTSVEEFEVMLFEV